MSEKVDSQAASGNPDLERVAARAAETPKPMPPAEFVPLGDSAIVVRFGECIAPELYDRVRALAEYLDAHPLPGLVEYAPAFATVALFYDPLRWSCSEFCAEVQRIVAGLGGRSPSQPRVIEIPVCYGGEFGPDLAFVAEHNHVTEDEVVSIHAGGEYLTYMIGFAPGFPYLGGMSSRIAAPRRGSPRPRIPAGSVGIAGNQTGVYPIETPGGWQLIGRTPWKLFRPWEDPPSLLRAGDVVRFRPIAPADFAAWQEEHR